MAGIALASIGAGLVSIGAAVGIGMMWSSGVASIARQPEIASKIQVSMLIGGALIEGLALFAMVICFMQI
jgi:F-type H+-transporting ATPase subunit c